MLSVFIKTFNDYRRSILLWSLGLFGLALMYASIWPSIEASAADLAGYLDHLPEALKNAIGNSNFTTASGYINGEIFAITGPLLFIIFAVGVGSNALAGEEEKGYLDIIFSYPVKRWEFVLAKSLLLFSLTVSLVGVLWLALVTGSGWQNMGLSTQNLASAAIDVCLLALVFGFLALFIGAATGRKGLAIGVTTILVLVSYLLNTLAPMVKELEKFQKFSPFYYYHNEGLLDKGADPGNLGILLAISLVFVVFSVIFFNNRDLDNG